jgi:hypothetical protein
MSKEYTIATVDDLFAIPADKLPLCLIELGSAIAMLSKHKKAGEPLLQHFLWVDDDAHEVFVQYPDETRETVCKDWTKLFAAQQKIATTTAPKL